MIISLKVSSTFQSHDHIWKVTCPEHKNPKGSNSLQVTLIIKKGQKKEVVITSVLDEGPLCLW